MSLHVNSYWSNVCLLFLSRYHTIGANIWHLSTLPVVRSNQWHLSSDSSNCHTHAWPLQIVPMRSDLFSSLNKVKHVCKQIQRHVYILDTTSLTRHGRTIKNLEWWLGTSDVKRGFPFFLHVWHFCVKSKNSLEPRFQPTSQFPPKNTYHMHTGLFFSTCVTIICVTYPKNILQPHFHGSSHLKKTSIRTKDVSFLHVRLLFAWHTQKKYLTASLSCRSYRPPILLRTVVFHDTCNCF